MPRRNQIHLHWNARHNFYQLYDTVLMKEYCSSPVARLNTVTKFFYLTSLRRLPLHCLVAITNTTLYSPNVVRENAIPDIVLLPLLLMLLIFFLTPVLKSTMPSNGGRKCISLETRIPSIYVALTLVACCPTACTTTQSLKTPILHLYIWLAHF